MRASWFPPMLLTLCLAVPASSLAQDGQEPTISVQWQDEPIREALLALAAVGDRSIVLGPGITGTVTATVEDQPWDVVLRTVADSHGLVVVESTPGVLRVVPAQVGRVREDAEAIVTRAYRIRYTPAEEMEATLAPLLSDRGSISVAASTNTVVISDVSRVHATIAQLLR